MIYRLFLCFLFSLPSLFQAQTQPPTCCEDATCVRCEDIQLCNDENPFSPEPSDSYAGGTGTCGIDLNPQVLCSTFWENNVYGVSNEMPATTMNPSGCLIISCGDPLASNYNPTYGPFTPAELQDCIYPVQASNYCLDGTIWSEELGGCVVKNPTDTDLDGCTGVDDMLDVLANFGFCIDTATASTEGIPPTFYNDSDVLLLLDFNTGIGDASSFSRNVTLSNYELGPDRYGTPNSALKAIDSMPQYIQGDCNDVVVSANAPTNCVLLDPPVTILADDNDAYALSMWIEHPNIAYDEGCFQSIYSSLVYGLVPIDNPPAGNTTVCYYSSSLNFGLDNWGWDGQACPSSSLSLSGWYLQGASWYGDTCFVATNPPEILPQHPYKTGWNHIAISKSNDDIDFYVNGQIQWQSTINADEQDSWRHYGALGFPDITLSNHDFIIELIRGLKESLGQSTNYYALDDILVLNRALTNQEVIDLYTPGQEAMSQGCTSCDACNYNGLAMMDDGSCDYSCYGCTDSTACNYDALATFTDNSCYFSGDTCNDNNSLTCGDVYNSNCSCEGVAPLDENGLGPCGGLESITYFNDEYALIEICGQCWFAENLRTSQFQNGDIIPTVCGVGNNSTLCSGTGHSLTIPDYGGQYNYWAYTDDRGLCPSGFHVPSLSEWEDLHAAVITELPEGESAANSLRGSISDFPAWTGSDLFGFSAIPAGSNCHTGNLGTFAEFATSSVVQSVNWNAVHGIYINDTGNGIGGVSGGVHNGWCRNVSVRCVKD